jgi:glycoprotein endo-alpha-1,2-mannosidase
MKNAVVLSAMVFAVTLFCGCQKKNVKDPTAAADYKHYSLVGKVMCGYQGWFNCPKDGTSRGWVHWSKGKGSDSSFIPANCHVDIWPDMKEMGADERYDAKGFDVNDMKYYVFSSHNRKTVTRHFEWMKEYGIDGVYLQRFVNETKDQNSANTAFTNRNDILSYCKDAANMYGRKYAVMYDLSGVNAGQMSYVMNDWKYLVDTMKVTRDPNDNAYMYHYGKPVVAVWGIGFGDKKHKRYSLAECAQLIDFFKKDPTYGGCTVMAGVPSFWRTFVRDSVNDPNLHAVIAKADIVSPWAVGRFKMVAGPADYNQTDAYAANVWKGDVKWCAAHHVEYLPVVFAGFSYHNASSKKPLNEIPRWGGNFLWRQFYGAKKAGATMIYVAMFDEVDEGTAILKGTNSASATEAAALPAPSMPQFVLYREDIAGQGPGYVPAGAKLPTDYYLWLTGQGGKMLRGEIPLTTTKPPR